MSKEKQIDLVFDDLIIDFDEMGFTPTTTVPDPEAYAIEWRNKLIKALQDYRKQSKGEWIKEEPWDVRACVTWRCSVCKETFRDKTKYCPNCGAKMKDGD